MAPVLEGLMSKPNVKVTLVHSGQHYDKEMSACFFRELDLPEPDVNLNIGSGSHAQQTAQMLLGYEKQISRFGPTLVLAQGDTNTVLAAGLASIKLKVSFGHVEAGLRSFDRRMPEETNRTIADHCSQLCFAPTQRSAQNLMREGIPPDRVFITGNTIVDVCRRQLQRARSRSRILEHLDLTRRSKFVLVTAHREENVGDPHRLRNIVLALKRLREFPIVFPIHPRTSKMLRAYGLLRTLRSCEHVLPIRPLGYWDFLRLLESCYVVLTDSGGVQEEALTVGTPCLTLRYNTERPETVEAGGNVLVGTEPSIIVHEVKRLSETRNLNNPLRVVQNPLGDGKSGRRIARICLDRSPSELRIVSPSYMKDGSAFVRLIRVSRERKIGWLQRRQPTATITQVYDMDGGPIFPHSSLYLRRGWHIQVFGEPSELVRFLRYLAA